MITVQETFMDEWTEFDIADPRYDTWALCWPDSEHGRFGHNPCPNMTLGPDGKWDKSPLWYSGWKFNNRNETLARMLNAEAANDWVADKSCGNNLTWSNPSPGCTGVQDQGTDYYRMPIGSYVDMMLYYQEKMLASWSDGIYYDNTYFDADYHPWGPGYIADTDVCDDGALHPGVGVWGIRDMARRTATLHHSMGKQHTAFMCKCSRDSLCVIVRCLKEAAAHSSYDYVQCPADRLVGDRQL